MKGKYPNVNIVQGCYIFFIIRRKGFWLLNSFSLINFFFSANKMRFCENRTLLAKVGWHARPPLPLRRQEEAQSADDARSSGNGGPPCEPNFTHSTLFSQNIILLSENKAIYSNKTNLLSPGKSMYAYDITFLGLLRSI